MHTEKVNINYENRILINLEQEVEVIKPADNENTVMPELSIAESLRIISVPATSINRGLHCKRKRNLMTASMKKKQIIFRT